MKQPRPLSREFLEVGLFLAPQYSLYELVPVIELFRIANQNAGRRLFNWSFISEDGGPVESGAGMTLNSDTSIHSDFSFDLVLVISGNNPVSFLTRPLVAWLQKLNAHGVHLGGIDTGAFALAEAGLLNDRRVTCHWEAIPIFIERYPDIDVIERRFIIDPPFMSCAGGIAALDMMLEFVEREHGPILARHIANGFVYPNRESGDGAQRLTTGPNEPGHQDPVSKSIELMESNIEAPFSVQAIAKKLQIPRRNLERLFRKKTQSSIAKYYMRVRLERSRELLFYGDDSISDISIICGFSSPAVFTRTFRLHFGQSPSLFRSSYSAMEMARFRPHVAWSLSETRSQRE